MVGGWVDGSTGLFNSIPSSSIAASKLISAFFFFFFLLHKQAKPKKNMLMSLAKITPLNEEDKYLKAHSKDTRPKSIHT